MESCSCFAGPIIFVKKGNGKLYICVDYRGLNAIASRDRYPMPYIDDRLDKLYRLQYFTKIYLLSEYHQQYIYMDEYYKKVFIVPDGLCKWRVLTFGVANIPVVFMYIMKRVQEQHHRYSVVYLDDIIVYLQSRQEHNKHVNNVLASIRAARLLQNNKNICSE
jgi:hypothetical protein